ncbi:MAG: hypothetical protein NNA25_10850 [Nitrospira sp.]|nr:hypothetical protein [Nitrospira sp.]
MGEMMDEIEEGKRTLLEMVKNMDATVQVVIPTAPSNSRFLISLTKGSNRKFLTLLEDDILDLPTNTEVRANVMKIVKETIATLEERQGGS